jgi:hypothetical protein
MNRSVFIYSAFAAVVLGSVIYGLDWQPAILSPMTPIQVVALPPPPPPPPQIPPAAAKPAIPAAPPAANARPNILPGQAAIAPVAPPPAKPLCDVAACAAAYRSFRESDCTFNPSFGPRQLCTKGVVPKQAATAPAPSIAPPATDTQPSIMQNEPGRTATPVATQPAVKCNVSACAAAYHSFTESDCTFLASGGERKLCTK